MKLILSIILFMNVAFGFNESDFQQKSYSTFVASEKQKDCKNIMKDGDSSLDLRMLPIRSDVRYTGNIRKISKTKTKYLENFSSTINKPLYKDYSEEIEIEDGLFKYWIPIQDQTLKTFRTEAKNGNSIRMYSRKLGCFIENGKAEIVTILINVGT